MLMKELDISSPILVFSSLPQKIRREFTWTIKIEQSLLGKLNKVKKCRAGCTYDRDCVNNLEHDICMKITYGSSHEHEVITNVFACSRKMSLSSISHLFKVEQVKLNVHLVLRIKANFDACQHLSLGNINMVSSVPMQNISLFVSDLLGVVDTFAVVPDSRVALL